MYFFLTIEAPEDGGLIAFGNALAGVGHFDLHIHFPQHHRHSDFPAYRGVLHRIIQQIKKSLACPFAVMGESEIFWAVHGHGDLFFLRCIHNPTHGLGHGIKEAARFLIQLNDTCFQTGGFHKGLKEKVQLIRLGANTPDEIGALRFGHRLFQQSVRCHFQIAHRRFHLMGNIRYKGL